MQTEEVIFGSTQLGQNIRDEPEVIGTLFGALKDGEMTQPIKGKELFQLKSRKITLLRKIK